jgi:hypothetical protein
VIANNNNTPNAVTDDFWTEHIPLFTAQFPTYYTKPQTVWGRIHVSEETYHDMRHEIVPLQETTGQQTYIMCHPYVREPKLTLSVGIYHQPKQYADQEAAIGKTIGQPRQEGFREVQVGNAQAWYYHTDKTKRILSVVRGYTLSLAGSMSRVA